MARIHIKKGILEFSTNEKRAILAKRLVVEVRYNSKINELSQSYAILGSRKEKE